MDNKKNKIFFLKNDKEFIQKLNKYNSINNNGSLNKIIQKKYNLLFNYLLPQISLALNKLHKVDENVTINDLEKLTNLYYEILKKYFNKN